MTLLSKRSRQHVSEYAREFSLAEPFRHVVIEEFLDPDFCQRLQADFPDFDKRHALNEMGQVGGKAVRMDVRDISEAYRKLDGYLQSSEFLDFVSAVSGIPELLYDPDYVGGGTHDNRHDQDLDAHVDFNYHPRTKWHRRLNLIVYLNAEWESGWGGELELHSNPWDIASNQTVSILPKINKAVIFETTENSWHGFSRIQLPDERRALSRRSFAIYLYTRERPPELTAPPHATIYVPAMMPVDWQPGRVLDDGDVRELRSRFARLRAQLRYLYDREKHFGSQIAGLEDALSEARSAQRLELQGYATQPRGVRGLWPDGWVAIDFSASFVPTRKAKALTIECWAPGQLQCDQVLLVEVDGTAYSRNVKPGASITVGIPLKAGIGREIPIRISASATWVPASTGESADQRALAFKLVRLVLEH